MFNNFLEEFRLENTFHDDINKNNEIDNIISNINSISFNKISNKAHFISNNQNCINQIYNFLILGNWNHDIINFEGFFKQNEPDFAIPFLCKVFDQLDLPIILFSDESYAATMRHLETINNKLHLCNIQHNLRPYPNENDPVNTELELSYIGLQKQLIRTSDYNHALQLSEGFLSLGDLRSNLQYAEVVLRDSNILNVDLSSIRRDQNPDCLTAPICGLSIIEMCQLMKYAGASDKLKIINVHGIDFNAPKNSIQAQILSHMLWYILEGIPFREAGIPAEMVNKTEYLIETHHSDLTFKFIHNLDSNRWFVNIPESDHEVFSCDEKDYLSAKNNELSPRITRLISKI